MSRKGRIRLFGMIFLLAGAFVRAAVADESPLEMRFKTINQTIEALQKEFATAGGGDWNRWFESLAPFRAGLKAMVAAAKPNNPDATGLSEARAAVIEARGTPPMFECSPSTYIQYLYQPENLLRWLEENPAPPAIVKVSEWLGKRGIDLIYVPVPKMTEVYPDRVLDQAPANRIVAPHIRKLILGLLESGVEVIDFLPILLKAREESPELLYFASDPHLSLRGRRIVAGEIVNRLKRYDFVQSAMASDPLYLESEGPIDPKDCTFNPLGAGYEALTPSQRDRIKSVLPTLDMKFKCLKDTAILDNNAEIIFIGDSYNSGIYYLVASGINMPVCNLSSGGQTTQAISDFFRDPGLLKNARVVIWINCNTQLAAPKWKLPPLD